MYNSAGFDRHSTRRLSESHMEPNLAKRLHEFCVASITPPAGEKRVVYEVDSASASGEYIGTNGQRLNALGLIYLINRDLLRPYHGPGEVDSLGYKTTTYAAEFLRAVTTTNNTAAKEKNNA